MNKKTLILAGLMSAAFLATGDLSAQARVNPARTSDLSDNDWNAWRTGVVTSEEGDKAYLARQYSTAAALYEKTIQLFQSVQKSNPSWNKKGLADRIQMLNRKLSAAQRRQAELQKQGGSTDAPTAEQKIAAVNADAVAEIAELKLALENVKKQNIRYKENLERAQKTADQIESLLKEKESMDKKHALLLLQYNDMKEKAESREVDQTLKTAVENEKQRSKNLEAELLKANLVAEELKKALNAAASEKTQLTASSDNLKKRIGEITALEKEITALHARLQQADQNAAAAKTANQQEVKRLTAELAKKSREVDEASEALTKLRASMDLSEAARQLEQTAAALRKENNTMQSEITLLRGELNRQKESAAALTDSASRTNTLAKNLSEQNQRLAADIEQMKKMLTATEENSRTLTAELAEARTAVDLLKKERDTFAEQLNKIPSEGSTANAAELVKARVRLQTLEEEKKVLTAKSQKAAELEKSLQAAEAKLKEANEEVTSLLGKENAALVALEKITALQSELNAKDQQLRTMQTAGENVKKREAEVNRQLENLKKLSADTGNAVKELEKLRGDLVVLKSEKAALETEREELKKQITYHEKKGKEYGQLISNEALLKSVLQENRILKVELESARKVKPEEKAAAELAEARRNMEQYQSRYQQNLEEMNKLKGSQLEMRLQMVEMEKQLTALRTENAELKKDPASKAELEKAQKAEQEKQNLRNQLEQNNKRISGLEAQIKELMQKNTEMIRREEVLKKENADLKAKTAASMPTVKALEDKIAAMEKAAAEQLKKADALAREKAAVEKELTAKDQQAKDAIAKQTKALEDKIAAMEKAAAEQTKKAEALAKEKAELQNALAQVKMVNSADVKQSAIVTAMGDKIATMEKAAAEQAKKAEALAKEKAELENRLKQIKNQDKLLGEQQSKIRSLEETIKAREQEIAKLNAANVNSGLLEKEIVTLKNELKAMKAAQAVPAADPQKDKEIAALKEELKNAQSAMQKLSAGSTAAQTEELIRLRKASNSMEAALRTLQQEKVQSESTPIETKKELLSAKANLEKLRAETAADGSVKRLQSELADAQQHIKVLTESGDKLKSDMKEVNLRNTTLTEQKEGLEKELAAVKKETVSLRDEIRKWTTGGDTVVQEKLKAKNIAIDQLLVEHAALTKQMTEQKSLAERAKSEAEKLRQEVKELKDQLDQQQKKNAAPVVTTGIRLTSAGVVAPAPAPVVDVKAFAKLMTEAAEYEKTGDAEAALWKYLAAADMSKNDWQPRFAMSRIYLVKKDAEKADKEYQAAVKLGMKQDAAHEKAIAALKQGK